MFRIAVCVLVFALAPAVACSGGASDNAANLQSPVRGLLRDVSGPSDGEPEEITLATDAGDIVTFKVELLEPGSVDVAHLRVHIEQELAVAVSFSGEGGDRVAYRIDDAP